MGRNALPWTAVCLFALALSSPEAASAAQSGDFTWTVRLRCARQPRGCSDAPSQGQDWKQLLMNVVPAAGVVFALNLFASVSRAELAGLEKSTSAIISGLEKSTAASISALEKSTSASISALEKSTAANILAVNANILALEKSTEANISGLKESISGLKDSTDAKIDASNKILYAYTSILDRMSKEASSKQQ